ncbi:MAG: DEAD/DEAH box helicase [Bacteroidales bacterium]|nr:DEAD/DEAH box helicase [Bacteroidales bacterium]MBK7172110.1 DEAD/DEAH box helicase [Bacteroidales bacterium]
MEGVEAIGYETPTPIQEQAIPVILEGRDMVACAQTGTGKTASFLLPIIHRIITTKHDEHIKCLIVVPTRELATQIDQHLQGLAYFTPVSSIPVYGGTDGATYSNEQKALKDGADIVICTPGRMLSHLNMGYVQITGLSYLVLDEADRMLDMGFFDDIMKIISFLPKERQNLLFSATMPSGIRNLARHILQNPFEINIATSKPAERVKQEAYVVYDMQKIPLVQHILKEKDFRSILVFCSTKEKAKLLTHELKKLHFSADQIHSDIDQSSRENVLNRFKSRELNILIATDILSRGIDIEDIDLVINFDVPVDAEDYIHRVGRTARAASEGEAITLINERDQQRFKAIEDLIEKHIDKNLLPEFLGASPLYNPLAKNQRNNKKRNFGRKKSSQGKENSGNRNQARNR